MNIKYLLIRSWSVTSIIFSFFLIDLHAQLQVNQVSNADTLAKQLSGSGIAVSNAILNCPAGASGTFNGISSNIGISTGVLLTNGNLINAVGPNNSASVGIDNGLNFSDPDISAIEPLATYDVCILQFDAVVNCDSMYVKFVFGSEEYPEFVNAGYNDAFGLFVTGSNPSGPAYSSYNMTQIPGSFSPVSINNVNNGFSANCPAAGPCNNCAYYVENCNGTSVQYDGFTTVIQKNLYVIPGNAYKFKFAIADAGDGIYDSGVFIGMGSFSCLGLSVPEEVSPHPEVNVFPNPFSYSTSFSFNDLPENSLAVLVLFDSFGREVRNETVAGGMNNGTYIFYANGLSEGLYFYKIESENRFLSSGKLMISE